MEEQLALLGMAREHIFYCIDRAEKYYDVKLPVPEIDGTLTGMTAGQHVYHRFTGKHTIRINIPLLLKNSEDFLATTIPHEVAHLVVTFLWPTATAHGDYWKTSMRNCFGIEPKRCHSYDVSEYRRTRYRYIYSCSCRTHRLSANLHNKIKKGYSRHCLSCKDDIYFTGERIKL